MYVIDSTCLTNAPLLQDYVLLPDSSVSRDLAASCVTQKSVPLTLHIALNPNKNDHIEKLQVYLWKACPVANTNKSIY